MASLVSSNTKILNKWKKSETITFISDDSKTYLFKTPLDKFYLEYTPTSYLVPDPPAWLQDINAYIFDKSPDLNTLLKEIEFRFGNYEELDFSSFDETEELLNSIDVVESTLRNSIQNNIAKSKSPLNLAKNSIISIPILFGGQMASSRLLSEYMTAWKTYRESNKISIYLYDNNIYNWRITMSNFDNPALNAQLSEINKSQSYDYIEINLQFHDILYPTYPPFIRVVKPRLANNLMSRIPSMKLVLLEYWTPARDPVFIINKIQEALEKHGVIDTQKATKSNLNQLHPLEEALIKLASLSNMKEEFESLDTQTYNLMFVPKENNTNSKASKSWAKGTGYSHQGDAQTWDCEKYFELQKEKDAQILEVLQKAINCLQNASSTEITALYDIVKNSFLDKFLRSHLQGTTMIELGTRIEFYSMILTLLQSFVTEESIFLLADDQNPDIYTILRELEQEGQRMKKFAEISDTNQVLITSIAMLYEMATPAYLAYKTAQNKPVNQELKTQDIKTQYVEVLEKLRYRDQCNFVSKSFIFSDESLGTLTSTGKRTLAREYGSLGKTLPIYYESSVFVRVDEQMNKMRVLITGPDNTPYDSGVYLFDVACGSKYPTSPPSMYLVNTGNVRQNPNLYNNGKVCLSLLGTWNGGSKGEGWGPHSTLSQLFISVQSLILHNNPYWNEPGCEGCSEQVQENYRQYVRYYNMTHAMANIIRDVQNGKYTELSEVILTHFRLKKNYILEIGKKWCEMSKNHENGPQQSHKLSKDEMASHYQDLKKLLEKL